MSAILWISGPQMKAADVVGHSALTPYRVDEKNVGQAKEDALCYLVCEDATSWDFFREGILTFLKKHRLELQDLASVKGVDHAVLDVALDFPEEIAAKFVRIDNDLLSAISELGLDLEISLYKAE